MNPAPQQVAVPAGNLEVPALLFVPDAARPDAPRLPGIVVLHDAGGPDDFTRQSAARLCQLGCATMAPDLYARSGMPADTGSPLALLNFTMALYDTQVVGDVLAALNYLAQRNEVDPERLALVGWGWGGAYALMAAANDARVRAAVDVGGPITYPVQSPQKPGSPLNFVADLEGALLAAYPAQDPMLPLAEVERLRGRLLDHDKVGEVKVYEGSPAQFWTNPSLPQTALLWRRIEQFLSMYLFEEVEQPAEMGYPNEASRLHA